MPSKYSANRNFLLNAFKSSDSSCSFPNFGTGVNISPLVSREISDSLSFLFDNLIILMSVLFSSIVAGVCATASGSHLALAPSPASSLASS